MQSAAVADPSSNATDKKRSPFATNAVAKSLTFPLRDCLYSDEQIAEEESLFR